MGLYFYWKLYHVDHLWIDLWLDLCRVFHCFPILSTKAISSLYQRYKQITLEIITKDPEPLLKPLWQPVIMG